jgi:hypothetical protein
MTISKPSSRPYLVAAVGLLAVLGGACGNGSDSGNPIATGGSRAGGSGGGAGATGGAPGAGGAGGGTCVPDYACQPVAPNTGDPVADCVARVNQFRACVCLPPLPRWTGGEACANQDAAYDAQQNSAHAGAQADICDWGNAQDECPGWTRATPASVIDGCLQMMFDEGPPPTASCTGTCYSDHGHYLNMTGSNYKNGVACGFYTTSNGAVWAVQNFK